MNNLPAVAGESRAGDSSPRTQHLCGHYLMVEEFVTLAELSDVRKTNFRVSLMSVAVKSFFPMGCRVLVGFGHASVQPRGGRWPEPFSGSLMVGLRGVYKIQGALLCCWRGCFFPCVWLFALRRALMPELKTLRAKYYNCYSYCGGRHFVLSHRSKYFIPYQLPSCRCCCRGDKRHNGCSR